jgi:hypothetical protein
MHNVTSSHYHITTVAVQTQQYILCVFLSYVSRSATRKYSSTHKNAITENLCHQQQYNILGSSHKGPQNFCPYFNQSWIFSTDYHKNHNNKFHENLSSGGGGATLLHEEANRLSS